MNLRILWRKFGEFSSPIFPDFLPSQLPRINGHDMGNNPSSFQLLATKAFDFFALL